jgi:hypothetical protein
MSELPVTVYDRTVIDPGRTIFDFWQNRHWRRPLTTREYRREGYANRAAAEGAGMALVGYWWIGQTLKKTSAVAERMPGGKWRLTVTEEMLDPWAET